MWFVGGFAFPLNVTVFLVGMAVPGKASGAWNSRDPVDWLISGRDTYGYKYS